MIDADANDDDVGGCCGQLMSAAMPVFDSAHRNSDETVETEVSSLPTSSQDSKNSISATEAFTLPVLERHGEVPASLDEGGQSALAGDGAGSAAASGSGSTAPGDGDALKSEKSIEDDDGREMPELTLYA